MALYLFFVFVAKIYPFGERSIASYDLSAQIAPFIEHFFDVFKGRSTLFYSNALGGGADMFGSLVYFVVSPFSPLFLVFGEGMVAEATVLVLGLKLGVIAWIGAWFATHLFTIERPVCLCIGVLYTFCGYTFVANTYINWLDFLMYMPFCVWAFKKFLQTGNFWPFSALMAACVCTSFSIACFAMLTVYPALVFYVIFNKDKKEILPFIACVSLAFVCALLIALPVWVPALLAYMRAGRGSGELLSGVFSCLDGWKLDGKEYTEKLASSLEAKVTYILADIVFVIGTVFYFCRSKLKNGLSKFMLVTGLLTLIPVFVDECMLLLNMGSYLSYALRFGFLNAIYFLGGACLGIDGLKLCEKEEKVGAGTRRKWIVPAIYCFIFGALFVAMALFFGGNYHTKVSVWFKNDSVATAIRQFAGRFAHSIGGIFAIGIFSAGVALILVTGIVLVVKKKLPIRILSFFGAAIVVMQGVFFSELLVAGNLSTQNIRFGDYAAMAQTLRERDDGLYRVRDYSNNYSSNICFEGETLVATSFSSMMDKNNFAAAMMFGYSGNGKNIARGNGGVILGDCVLGYKYLLVDASKNDGSDKATADSKSWYDPVMVDVDGKQEHLCIQSRPGVSDAVYVYENDRVFPMTFVVDSGEFRFVAKNTSENRKKNQLAFYHYLAGSDEVETVTGSNIMTLSEKLWADCGELSLDKNTITVSVNTKESGKFLMIPFVALDGFTATVNGRAAQVLDNDIKFLCVALDAGANTVVFTYQSPYGTYILLSLLMAVAAVLLVVVILKRTKLFQRLEKAIGGLGVAVTCVVLGFFFTFPMCVFGVKCLMLIGAL